jgi:isopropylmalate/homocitrate/citramalate synthase
MTNLLPPLSSATRATLDAEQVSLTAKLDVLRALRPHMLDVSIREPTAYSSWAHRVSDKMDILSRVHTFGFRDVVLGAFKDARAVDDAFCEQLTDAQKEGGFGFSELGVLDGAGTLVVDATHSIPLGKVARLVPNVLFEFGVLKASEADAADVLDRLDQSIAYLRHHWTARGIDRSERQARVYVNIYDTLEAFYRNTDVWLRVVTALGRHPGIDGVLFEDEVGSSFHFQIGAVTRLIRSVAPAPKKLLVHIHEASGTAYAGALEAILAGADGLWAGFTPLGGHAGHAASSVFLASLLRAGNPHVGEQFRMQTMVPLARALDARNQPPPTDPLHPVIGAQAYDSSLRDFEQHEGDPMGLPPEAVGAVRGFRVVPAIANVYALRERLDQLGITYDAPPAGGDAQLDPRLFAAMWDLMQQALIDGRKVDCSDETVLRELLDRARTLLPKAS